MDDNKLDFLQRKYMEKGLKGKELEAIASICGNDARKLRRLLQRRYFGEPLDYVLRKKEFYGRDFYVDRRCYVPNKETEMLVKTALDSIPNGAHRLIDVGTGCGNIAITLKKERPMAKVFAVDIDPGAIEVARINSNRHMAGICLLESFYVESIPAAFEPDFIVSDLPWGNRSYVLQTTDMDDGTHMPEIAFFHPEGILSAYSELFESVLLKGWHPTIFIETGRIPKEMVKRALPRGSSLSYVALPNDYSVSTIRIRPHTINNVTTN